MDGQPHLGGHDGPVAVHEVRVSGLEYVALATDLLRRVRLADADAGVWEAADLQWWWREPRRSDVVDQVFWIDDTGPVAAVVLTDWKRAWGCDCILVPGTTAGPSLAAVWARAVQIVERVRPAEVETLVRDDDTALRALVTESGFVARDDGSDGTCWMDADSRPPVAHLPTGFAIVDRERATDRPHPMRHRNGPDVQSRLLDCGLYDPALDLAVHDPDGGAAGYALFWFDPLTRVGLVEPMRVEDGYQRRGLARALLTEGLERLARCGARRLKVSYVTDAARALYEGAGFQTTTLCHSYTRAG
jgi:ribosomal protein S18 acetylase RimI-like enzyme